MNDKIVGKHLAKKVVYSINKEGNRVRIELPVKKSKNSNSFEVFRYMNLGYYLVIPLLVGLVSGIAIDKWLDTKPLFTIILLTLGIFSTFYNLFKMTKS